MMLRVKTPSGHYRDASKDEILEAALEFHAKRAFGEEVTPANAPELIVKMIGDFSDEHAVILYLDSRSRLIAAEVPFRGSVTSTEVHARVVVRRALELNATMVVLGHNHPVGGADPSDGDVEATKALGKALRLFDIVLLDHFVVNAAGEHNSVMKEIARRERSATNDLFEMLKRAHSRVEREFDREAS